jgi:Caspase domain
MIPQEQETPKDIFVSIAVSRPEGLTPLPGALTGARDMASWARSKGYSAVHIDDTDGDVSVKRIRTDVEKAIKQVHETSPLRRIVFYFAGHGAAQNVNDTLWLLSRWHTDTSEAIRVPNLQRVLRTYHPAQVAFIGDSCRVLHKYFLDTLGSAVLLKTDENPTEFELDQFFAADAGEAAFMVVAQGSTDAFCIFTDVLLNALEGDAPASAIARPSMGTVVTSGQLAAYLRAAVPLKASEHNVVLTPVPRPGFIEPREVYAILQPSAALEADEGPQPAPPPIFDPDTVPPPPPPNIDPDAARPEGDAKLVRRERDRRREIAQSLKSSFAEEDHPQRFETHSGISMSGAEAKEIAAPPDVVVTPDRKGTKKRFRVGKSDVDHMTRPFADLLVKISRDHWAYAFAVPEFITALTIRNRGSVGVKGPRRPDPCGQTIRVN